jgi:hypothetical protein
VETQVQPLETYGNHGCYAYHYTTANAAFGHILSGRELRFNRLADMRDPVENKDWVQVLFPPLSWSVQDMLRWEETTRNLIHETRVLSLTLDSSEVGRRPEHARGYARPRMWEQYAENHCGACLVFDLECLRAQVELGVARFRRAISGEVVYSDSPLPNHETARSLDAKGLIIAGSGDYKCGLEAHIDEHSQELFFRKLTDWSTESEYRFVVLDGSASETVVPFGNTLRAVILGEQFPEWQISAAAEACRAADVDLRQIRWGAFPPGVFDPCAKES